LRCDPLTRPLAIVVALADNGVIGRDNKLIWRLKTDLKRFRELTIGKPMIIGRKTHESIGGPLPGRETIVLTRDKSFSAQGVHVVHSWDEALSRADRLADSMEASEIAVGGGAEIYKLALPQAQRLYLTLVHTEPEGEAVFPPFDRAAFREIRRESHPKGPDDEYAFTFVDLERRPAAALR
jgi:dihydrofolate reductase